MQEVFRAMSTLGYEWKVITPFNIRVRKWNPVLQHHFKIMLQLYQVSLIRMKAPLFGHFNDSTSRPCFYRQAVRSIKSFLRFSTHA